MSSRLSRVNLLQPPAPLRDLFAGLRLARRLVHGVVDQTAESVDRQDRVFLVARQKEERPVEIRSAPAGDSRAVGVISHVLPKRSPPKSFASSDFLSVGRDRKTSKSTASILSKILIGPSHMSETCQ